MARRFDDFGGGRWDRDRFERFSRGPGAERDYIRLEERDRGLGRSDILLDERHDRRGPRGLYEERERFFEEDRYGPPPRRAATFLEEPLPPEVSRRALAPYRPRPQFLRRQSSLDTFDRRPAPRDDGYRLPSEVPIPLPIRRPVSPSRGRFYEEYEERRRGSDDDYDDIRIHSERKGNHRSRSRMRSRSVRRRRNSSTSSESSFEEVKKEKNVVGKKGRTKLPKRLAHKAAIIEMGYPFEEEENFIIVQRALQKDHIDEIITKSKTYTAETKTYKFTEEKKAEKKEEKKEEARPAPPPAAPAPPVVKPPGPLPPPGGVLPPPPPPGLPDAEVVKTTKTTTRVVEPPVGHHHHQDLAVMVPERHRNSEADIRREIALLERERQMLKYERDQDDWEFVEKRPRDVVRVEKDRKGRMALVRSAH